MKYTDMNETSTFEIPAAVSQITTVHTELETGYINNTYYPFLSGILVFLNDVHSSTIPVGHFFENKTVILINYCISGRCEFKVSESNYKYMRDNYTSVGSLLISDSFYYPSDTYQGFEICIVKESLTEDALSLLRDFEIDLDELDRKYNNTEKLSIIETDAGMQRLWLELYHLKNPDNGLIKLILLKILYHLTHKDGIVPASTSYLTGLQAQFAKKAHDILTKDISERISMREIAVSLGTSETGLKNYFSAMYGMNVSDYMRLFRLKKAARLLCETKLPIADISVQCGYSNQGRFAKLFKEHYGMLPLEYRHL